MLLNLAHFRFIQLCYRLLCITVASMLAPFVLRHYFFYETFLALPALVLRIYSIITSSFVARDGTLSWVVWNLSSITPYSMCNELPLCRRRVEMHGLHRLAPTWHTLVRRVLLIAVDDCAKHVKIIRA
jgi:hypothetical protein